MMQLQNSFDELDAFGKRPVILMCALFDQERIFGGFGGLQWS